MTTSAHTSTHILAEPHQEPAPVPAVSVCLPVYQGAALVGRAVQSVLDQSLTDFELVVRDNACTDGTAEILASFDDPRIRVETAATTAPLPENWNRTVELARAPLVKILCADDLLHPDCLARQVAEMNADPGLALTSGRVDMLDDDGEVLVRGCGLRGGLLGTRAGNDVIRAIVRHGGNPVGQPVAVLFRRADFEAVGAFDPSKVFLMDLDLWARLLTRGRMYGSQASVAGYRIGLSTVSGQAGRREFRGQRAFTIGLAADSSWLVPSRDVAVGALGAYTALARRHGLVAATRLRNRGGRYRGETD